MSEAIQPCVFERVASVEIRHVREDLGEVRERVGKLETIIARGIALLLANLAGVGAMLVPALLQ